MSSVIDINPICPLVISLLYSKVQLFTASSVVQVKYEMLSWYRNFFQTLFDDAGMHNSSYFHKFVFWRVYYKN